MSGVTEITDRSITGADRRVYAAIDANLNRAMEGLRVSEDILRFCMGRADLSVRLKEARHRIREAAGQFPREKLLGGRNVEADAQKFLDLEGERKRGSLADLFSANLHRAMEAVRSLEEFGKLVLPDMTDNPFQAIRFFLYQFEGDALSVLKGRDSMERFRRALYGVLDFDSMAGGNLLDAAGRMARGGASIIHFEAGAAASGEALALARELASFCRGEGVLFIVGGRVDSAILAGADGLHLGAFDPGPRDVRDLVPPGMVIGAAASSPGDAARVAGEGADYITLGSLTGGPDHPG
ncbi:MAG: hypothetical protein E4G96_04925, partial [Chrysiogenales bacterium]